MNTANVTQPSRLRRSLDGLYALGGVISSLCVLIILLLMVGASLGRSLDWRVSWINDVVSWLCAAAAFFGMAYSFRNGDFVRVTLLLEKVSPRTRHWLEVISLATASVAICYQSFWAARFTYQSWEFNDIAGNMVAIPLWIPQLSFVIGAAILFVAVVDECVCVLRGGKPSYVVRVEERHARGDFSEEL
jgi:TRAP-type C4-dicarboxylate transport system permease small subunit